MVLDWPKNQQQSLKPLETHKGPKHATDTRDGPNKSKQRLQAALACSTGPWIMALCHSSLAPPVPREAKH